ncbi:Uncharacterized protein ALO88_05605 [Pseudomonas syringae pv. antirrhini]|uniref:Uncharacterized protein n=1 Tax=Pseudomonas syringae pv. antirrhini TaxID=251702 RepID=A0A0P9JN00_9PSED|nr:Uncharacterized protein ALO88_05605 [Pseudomonas syringae pv. antirrhini]
MGAHVREQDHVPDRRRVGEQHHQPVDTDPLTRRGRHAVFQRTNKVGVVVHGFVVTGVLVGHLGLEAFGLIFSVIELGVGVGNLAAADEQLETVSDVRVVIVATGQRRHFERVLGDEVGLFQLVLDQFFENHHLQFAQSFEAEHFRTRLLGDGARLVHILQIGSGQLRVVLEDRIEHRQAHERFAEVKHLVAVRHVGAAQHQLRQLAEQFFGEVHVVFVVSVGLVELEHGELGVMPGRNTFVTEVAVDLEDFLETADHQPLEVQLRCNTQEHFQVQCIVVGFKRLGCRTARNGLQHRRFNFKEVTLHQEAADVSDDLRAHTEGFAHVFVDDQVNVTLAVALLGIGQAVVLVGQRAQRLGQQAHAGHFDVQVALAGACQRTFGRDDVAQVPGFHLGQGFFRQGFAIDIDLDAPGHVLDDHERTTVKHDATGNLDRDRCLCQFFLGLVDVLFLQVIAVAVAAEVVGEGLTLGTAGSKLFLAQGDQGVFFLLQGLRVELLVAHVFRYSITGSPSPCSEGLEVSADGLQPLLEARDQVFVDIAIKHLVAVAAFDVGSQILDTRGVQNIRANLMTPADIRLGVFERLGRCVALLHFLLIQTGPQHFHGGVLVRMLGTFVLATDHSVGRNVGNTYRRVGGVYVLTTGTRGAVGVDTQIRRVDVDFDVVIDFRRHEHGRERGVTAVAGVERALAHQTVHADFGAQPAKGIFTLDVHGSALDTGDFTGGQLHDGGVEAALVGPAQVHTQQDVGPVLGFGAAGTGLDVQIGVVGVHLATEHAAEFELFQRGTQALDFGSHVVDGSLVFFFGGHQQQVFGVDQPGGHFVQGFDDLRQQRALAPQLLSVGRVVPDIGIFELAVYFGQTIMFVIVVKDTPEWFRSARTNP